MTAVPGWQQYPGLLAVTTTREGGVSTGRYASLNLALHVGDDPALVLANRSRVSGALGIDPGSWTLGQQVHGNGVAVVTATDRGRGALRAETAIEAADALVTEVPDVCLCVLIADCVPVMLFDPGRQAIGLAHAGWRGTAGHVSSATVRAMRSAFGSRPDDLRAFLGPSIGPDDYVVGDDVAQTMRTEYADACIEVVRDSPDGSRHLDLRAANVHDLHAAGLLPHHIAVTKGSTTRPSARLYSHRAFGPTGRFAALLGIVAP